ncbi:hypothetical protein NERG_02485 [Nematocida ausubeli]|uniref:Uncharacterized protein n=1 Tax=Nematocida ausubeli (strain ATCC PRA-371 / ERTm2) TaxID=1913371 RepID=H8ZFW4_NEMA1|nr:hypothetical protein NERG_02485 [Nematocida ausubeli]
MLAKKDHSKAQKKSTSIAGRMKRFFLGAFKSKAKVSDTAESPLPCEETLRKGGLAETSSLCTGTLAMQATQETDIAQSTKKKQKITKSALESAVDRPVHPGTYGLDERSAPAEQPAHIESSSAQSTALERELPLEPSADANSPANASNAANSLLVGEPDIQAEEVQIKKTQAEKEYAELHALVSFMREIEKIAQDTEAMGDVAYLPVILFFTLSQKGFSLTDDLLLSSEKFHSIRQGHLGHRAMMDETAANCLVSEALAPLETMTERLALCRPALLAYVSLCNSVQASIFVENKKHTMSETVVGFVCEVLKYIKYVIAAELLRIDLPSEDTYTKSPAPYAHSEAYCDSALEDSSEQSEEACPERQAAPKGEALSLPGQDESSFESRSLSSGDELADNVLFKRQKEKYQSQATQVEQAGVHSK